MQLNDLRPAEGARKARKRIGRGTSSGYGTTAGRGTKGQLSRTGGGKGAGFEGGQQPLAMRLPKLPGFKNRNRVEYQPVNVGRIAELFPQGGEVNVEALVAAGAVRAGRLVKVLGEGDVNVKLNIVADAWSGSAQAKVEAAGGSITAR